MAHPLSPCQIKQWAEIERQVSYAVTCRICKWWGDVTDSRAFAEALYREHHTEYHTKADAS